MAITLGKAVYREMLMGRDGMERGLKTKDLQFLVESPNFPAGGQFFDTTIVRAEQR